MNDFSSKFFFSFICQRKFFVRLTASQSAHDTRMRIHVTDRPEHHVSLRVVNEKSQGEE